MSERIEGLHAHLRFEQTDDTCPIDGLPELDRCRACPYFRGASYLTGRGTAILCNWPVNGARRYVRPIPDVFTEAFEPD